MREQEEEQAEEEEPKEEEEAEDARTTQRREHQTKFGGPDQDGTPESPLEPRQQGKGLYSNTFGCQTR